MSDHPPFPFARTLRALAGLSCFSLAAGFIGVAAEMGEGVFLLFATCTSSIAGLVLLACVNASAARDENADEIERRART